MNMYLKKQIFDAITELSKIKSECSLFDVIEADKYYACKLGIHALRKIIGEESIFDKDYEGSIYDAE